ncbi:MAG: hypothetical protein H0T53_07740, partial [Herpetosiphonaceae bacterium]|nr:hypothetical protein [Herpetosiphonaceae bacterium]
MKRHRWPCFVRVGLILFLLSTFLWQPAPFAQASGVIFVAAGGAGSQSGADWANARDLHAALQTASSGSQIWVKQGTYAPTTSAADRSATFQLVNGVALYGGFAGVETELSQRNIAAYTATLSGAFAQSYHVVTGSGT